MLEEKNNKIWTIEFEEEEKFLRKKASEFDFSRRGRKEIEELIRHMRTMMVRSGGIGLSANQIGIDAKVFVAQLPNENGVGYVGKFYAVFNPKIKETSSKEENGIEGCLSVPNKLGNVKRFRSVVVVGFNKRGEPVEIKAKDLLARVFQHEIDHLNGVLFIDRTKEITEIENE